MLRALVAETNPHFRAAVVLPGRGRRRPRRVNGEEPAELRKASLDQPQGGSTYGLPSLRQHCGGGGQATRPKGKIKVKPGGSTLGDQRGARASWQQLTDIAETAARGAGSRSGSRNLTRMTRRRGGC
jgi:hypothetical protein